MLSAAVLLLNVASGQENPEKNGKNPKEETNPNAIEVRFADGSVVKMVLLTPAVDIGTRYGKLKVPSNEIRRIEFGLRVPEATLKRIDDAIGRLGSPEFKLRNAASEELLALKEAAYPLVRQAAKSKDPEVVRRAEDILKKMTEQTPIERLRLKKQDTIVTTEFTIAGQIETAILKARTPYFGEVQLQLTELRSMRWLGSERDAHVVVDAAKHGGQQESWLDTEIEVVADVGLEITASGTVDLWPVPGQAGVYTASPTGMLAAGGGVLIVGGKFGQAAGGAYSPGALLGRIGKNGKVFFVGAKYEGAPTEEGKLYLRIAPSSWGNESSGTYNVRVSTGGNK
jgi:hypothetical protein